MQLGKCAYSGEPIDINQIMSDAYCNIDHIWPRRVIKDDSVLNNKVLCKSEYNGKKIDKYPVPSEWRAKMLPVWEYWRSANLITEEKFKRLTRRIPFTDEELYGFINRQLVETRQSTKVIAELLQEKFPNTEIVYVKAGLVSDFRHEYDIIKSRLFNDLHHAKDAYLNIVVGNVYNSRFTKDWFFKNKDKYSMKTENIFKTQFSKGNEIIWNGKSDIEKVKNNAVKNSANVTKYAFCRKGGFFKQMPVKAGKNLAPLKQGLDTEKYGGYNKTTASYFVFARFNLKGKYDVMLVPVELLFGDISNKKEEEIVCYVKKQIENAVNNNVDDVTLPLGNRKIMVNTTFSFDGLKMTLAAKTGESLKFKVISQFCESGEYNNYLVKLEKLVEKIKNNKNYVFDEIFDKVSCEKNIEMYKNLKLKSLSKPYVFRPNSISEELKKREEIFNKASAVDQAYTLIQIHSLLAGIFDTADLTRIGGKKEVGNIAFSCKLSVWKKKFCNIKIIDNSASALYGKETKNILDLL